MKIGIIGYGTEGKASFEYFNRPGNTLTILDANEQALLPAGVASRLGPDYLSNLADFDVVVRSPGIRLQKVPEGVVVTTATKEFFKACPAPIIGVTGTKGKGTTSTLIAHILERAGKTVWLGGNIGRAGLDFLPQVKQDHFVVLEMSSFQLSDLERSPHIAVCLMIVPEHQDWHHGMEDYVAAKGTIARHQTQSDLMVYHAHNHYALAIAELSAGRKVPYLEAPGAHIANDAVVIDGVQLCSTSEVGLVGPHNLENICAAVTATWELIGKDARVMSAAIQEFKGLPYRIERRAVINGITYVNDSFAVNPSSTIAAVKSFTEPKIMILGGFERGISLREMTDVVAAANPRGVVVIGETGPAIMALLAERGYRNVTRGGSTMDEIVMQARSLAQPGDIILLSPGCASFGLFKSYKDRGDQFNRVVAQLEETA